MALNIDIKDRIHMGSKFGIIADVTFDDSYPTGGEAITERQLGLNVIDLLLVAPSGGNTYEYLPETGKIKGYTAAATEIADKTDLKAVVVKVFAVGY